MGANDAAEQLEVAKAECVRLERALIAIRDLMQETNDGLHVTVQTMGPPLNYSFLRDFASYSIIRTAKIRTTLEAVGYPITFPTPEDKARTAAIVAELEVPTS